MPQDPFAQARESMVREQIEARGLTDQTVLNAMRRVPRHLFVPRHLRGNAYADHPLPIDHQQTISQPYIVAAMTAYLDLEPGDRVLEVGTGSGYQAAVLAEIVRDVFSIEIIEPLGRKAARVLHAAGYDNVHTRLGDGYEGWPSEAPFDAIIVTAAPEEIPPPLIAQLKPGGRMIIPVGPVHAVQQLILLKKTNHGDMQKEIVMDVRFVPLTRHTLE